MEEDPAHSINFASDLDPRFHISPEPTLTIINFCLTKLNLEGWAIDVSFVSADNIQSTNQKWRGKDHPTDVLSFPQYEFDSPRTFGQKAIPKTWESSLGDIVICPQIAFQQAAKIGQPFEKEVCFLLVHGILHLCGHDHQSPEEEALMLPMQRELMREIETQGPHWRDIAETSPFIGASET